MVTYIFITYKNIVHIIFFDLPKILKKLSEGQKDIAENYTKPLLQHANLVEIMTRKTTTL